MYVNWIVGEFWRIGIIVDRGPWAAYSVLMLRRFLNKILTGMILLMGQLNCSRLLATDPRAILPSPSEASQIGHRACNLRGRRTKLNNVTVNVTHRHIYIRIATHYKLAAYVPFQLCSLLSWWCFCFICYMFEHRHFSHLRSFCLFCQQNVSTRILSSSSRICDSVRLCIIYTTLSFKVIAMYVI
jgi:hypothetical protein